MSVETTGNGVLGARVTGTESQPASSSSSTQPPTTQQPKLEENTQTTDAIAAAHAPPKKKQKRNKPTLSCEECVERKTKCDRGRPTCLACIKRQTECRYSEVANLIASAENGARRPGSRPRKQSRSAQVGAVSPVGPVGSALASEAPTPRHAYRSTSTSSTGSSPFLLSNVPYSNHSPSHIFGLGSEHPFANYWTCQGGLPEVVGVLPSKDQADILVMKYFTCVDPVYPLIHRRTFYSEYERFWGMPLAEKQKADASTLALHFVVYALGTQFVQTPSDRERAQMAEFYLSASHQALRISGYLSRISLRTIQAMVLICYALMNDNHASDAWAFGGVLMRQAYAIGLNRDPNVIVPRASKCEKQQRRKVWQSVLFQDTFLTVLLKLPPTAMFSDVDVEGLTDDSDDDSLSEGSAVNGTSGPPNPMSISSIAPPLNAHLPHELPDREYIRSMWRLANLVQRTVCKPRSLGYALTNSTREKADVLQQYRVLFASFPIALTTADHAVTGRLASTNPRLCRQNLFLRSNYWHCLMIVLADENEPCGVRCDVRGALEAARMAIGAFFLLWELMRTDAGVWWVFQHRAFEEALTISRLLSHSSAHTNPSTPHNSMSTPSQTSAAGCNYATGTSIPNTPNNPTSPGSTGPVLIRTVAHSPGRPPGYGAPQQLGPAYAGPASPAAAGPRPPTDPLFQASKNDVRRMLDILEHVGSTAPEMQKTRTEVLRSAFEEVGW